MRAMLLVMMAMTVMGVAFGQADPQRTTSMPADVGPGRVAWFDLTTTDLSKSKEFYGKLFDWKFCDPAGHPLGMYSRTPIASQEPASKL